MIPQRKILIVEDDALLRGLLGTQLRTWGFDVSEASTPREATDLCRMFDPDGVILDVDLGDGPNGFQLAEALGRQMPHLAIVFLTRFPDARATISRMSPALRGASYVNKSAVDNSDDVLVALNAALGDSGIQIHQDFKANPLTMLTTRQLEVLRLMHEGKTNNQIAQLRGRSLSSVDNLVTRIFRTLEIDRKVVNPRATAIRLYAENYGYLSR